MRLVVARCEVTYSGRLSAFLPESTRLLMLKADGSVLVHADAGGYKPLNWMTPPTVVEEEPGQLVIRKRAGKSEDRLEVRLLLVIKVNQVLSREREFHLSPFARRERAKSNQSRRSAQLVTVISSRYAR